MRIDLPAGEDPVIYTMMKMGSSRLLQSRHESWDAQFFNDSTITPREREVARMRMAHHMSCTHCTAFRGTRDAPELIAALGLSRNGFSDEEIPEELYERVFEYATWPGYTERERLTIEFAERFMIDYQDMADDDAFWERLKANFSETEIADLCLLVGMWDSSCKMFHLLIGIEDACRVPPKDHRAADRTLQMS